MPLKNALKIHTQGAISVLNPLSILIFKITIMDYFFMLLSKVKPIKTWQLLSLCVIILLISSSKIVAYSPTNELSDSYSNESSKNEMMDVCDISISLVSMGACNDQGTIDPSDDTQAFTVKVVNIFGGGSSVNIEINGEVVFSGANYNTNVLLEYGAGKTFTVTGRDPSNPTCCSSISITTGPSCSVSCNIAATFTQGACNVATQSIPVSVAVTGSAGRTWQIVLISWTGTETIVSTGSGNLTKAITIPYSETAGAPLNYYGASLRVEWTDKTPCSTSWTNGPCGGVFPPPTGPCTGSVTIGGNQTLCSTSNLNLSANTSGGTGPFTYVWSQGAHSQGITVSNVPSSNYTVTVIDANYCKYTASTYVTTKPITTPYISGQTNICNGQSATLTSFYTYSSYRWSNNMTTKSITINTAGTYTLTVTSANGCTSSNSITVTALDFFIAEISYIKTQGTTGTSYGPCAGQNFSMAATTSSNATGPLTYKWNSGATTYTVPGVLGVTYSVTVTSGAGCTATTSLTATASPSPAVTLVAASEYFCNRDYSNSIRIDAVSPTAIGYSWSNGETCCPHIAVNSTGTYGITVTNAEGCKSTKNIVITNNDVNATIANAVVCGSGLKNLNQKLVAVSNGATPKNFIWSNGYTSTGLNSTLSGITAATSGIYTVTVSYLNCSNTASGNVTIINGPTVGLVAPSQVCGSSNVTLTASGGGTYAWNTGATTANNPRTVTTTTTYTVTVSLANGFCADSESATIQFIPIPTINISGNRTVCPGEYLNLTETNNYAEYIWKQTSNNYVRSIDQFLWAPGGNDYIITVTDNFGCKNTSAFSTYNYSVVAPNLANKSVCFGTNATLSPANRSFFNTFLWSTGATSSSIVASISNTYSLSVTDLNGCKSTDDMQFLVKDQLNSTMTQSGLLTPCSTNITLTASGGNTYLWQNLNSTSKLLVNAPGVYTVTVTDVDGCKNTHSRNIVLYKGIIGNYVWRDNNHNGIQDEGSDQGLNGVQVVLVSSGSDLVSFSSDDVTVGTTVTANNPLTGAPGYYNFTICSGTKFYVSFPKTIPGTDYSITYQTTVDQTNGDSDANSTSGKTRQFDMDILASGILVDNQTIDAGYWGLTLPITLKEFNVQGRNCEVLVSWVTSSEKFNKEFIVQKSNDGGLTFYDIYHTDGLINSVTEKHYSYIDKQINNAGYVYRLVQVDLDGTVNVFGSKFTNADCAKFSKNGINGVYPNPLTKGNALNVVYYSEVDENVSSRIYDSFGKLIQNSKIPIYEGQNRIIIQLDDLISGYYILNIQDNNGNNYSKAIIVQ